VPEREQVCGRTSPRDPHLATCGFGHTLGLEVVVTVGSSALLLFWRGHGDRAPEARPAPRFERARGLLAETLNALLVARSAHAVLAGRRPRAANRSPRPHGDPGAVEAAHKGRCHCCKGPELPRGLSAVVGPGCAGDDLGEHLADALVVGGVQPQQRLAELEPFGVLLEPPGADGQAV